MPRNSGRKLRRIFLKLNNTTSNIESHGSFEANPWLFDLLWLDRLFIVFYKLKQLVNSFIFWNVSHEWSLALVD